MSDVPASEAEASARAGREWAFWGLALLVPGLAWRFLRYGLCLPMWGDEAFVANNFFIEGWAHLFQPLQHLQIAPAGFLVFTKAASTLFGHGEYALRLVAFASGVASLLVFRSWSRRVLGVDGRAAILGLGWFCASYFPVRHAAEVKPYSMDLLVSVALLFLAWRVRASSGKSSRPWKRWAVFGSAGVIAPWFSFPSVFIVTACGALLCLRLVRYSGWREGFRFAAIMIPAGLSFLVMWHFHGSLQAETNPVLWSDWADYFPPLDRPWTLPIWLLDVHTGNLFAYPVGGKNFGSAPVFLLFCAGVLHLLRTRRTFLAGLLVVPFLLMLAASFLGKYPYGGSARIHLQVAPLICLGAGVGLAAVIARARGVFQSRLFRSVCGVLIVLMLVQMVALVQEPWRHRSDALCREAVVDLMAGAAPGDRLIVFGSYEGSEHVPRFASWAGSCARFRYNMLNYAPSGAEVLWGPDPDAVKEDVPGVTRLVVYRHPFYEFPEAQFDAYLSRLSGGAVVSKTRSYDLAEGAEAIDVFVLGKGDAEKRRGEFGN